MADDANDLVGRAILDMFPRVEALEKKIGQLHFLVIALLQRTGLDREGVLRALGIAEEEHERITKEVSETLLAKWRETPEGREATRNADELWRRRQREIWREECIEDRRIYPDPSARTDPKPEK
jgi:hypothetical protein